MWLTVTKSILGNSFKGMTGGINLSGPIFLNGDALSENTGSVRITVPAF